MDLERFETEYRRARDRLFTFLLRLTGNRTEAEEVFQEASLKAWKERGGFAGESSFSTWLTAIALNTWRSSVRRKKLFVPWPETETQAVADPAGGPEDSALADESIRNLDDALSLLEVNHRSLILLRYMEGLSYREIGKLQGISEEAARVGTYRARNALLNQMKETRP